MTQTPSPAMIARVSYPTTGNDQSFAVEDSSFWFQHRNRVIGQAIRQHPPAGEIYDIGGGNGFVSQGIEAAGFPTVLVEPGPSGAANARRRGLTRVVCATLETAGFEYESLPAAGLFDVLEHIEDDAAFLRSLAKHTMPGGHLYLTVPAYRWLWAHDDVFAGHFRRYTLRSLRAVLEANGFEVEFSSYFFSFLPLPILLTRCVPSWLGLRRDPTSQSNRSEHSGSKGLCGRILDGVMAWEQRRIARGKRVWTGSSCLVVARRK